MRYVTHLESALDGTRLDADRVATLHRDRPLWVRYDLAAVGAAVGRSDLKLRPWTPWRYRELLPPTLEDEMVSLGEVVTPLLDCPRLAKKLGLRRLRIKDESPLPTGSFKARGLAMAVTMARQFGIRSLAIPTAGNAGGAMAAYAARAGMEAWVFLPADTPRANQAEAHLFGAHTYRVDGLIHDCAAIVRGGVETMGWFDLSTLKEPYRIEGKKTMGLELAEQLDWRLPSSIFYPTGGGTGLIGMWKAFQELCELGWLEDESLPRMWSCQAAGCAPLAEAFSRGERFGTPPERPFTRAAGLRVPRAIGDFMILDAVRASGGRAVAAAEDGIDRWQRWVTESEGISLCPESAVCIGAIHDALRDGSLDPEEDVVVFNTGAAQKSFDHFDVVLPSVDAAAPDYAALLADRAR